jgi:hypothetical protein
MTQHYTLADREAQESAVLALQAKVRRPKVVAIQRRIKPQQAKKSGGPAKAKRGKVKPIKGLGGGPERTRISDLYRVKVAL